MCTVNELWSPDLGCRLVRSVFKHNAESIHIFRYLEGPQPNKSSYVAGKLLLYQ